jgi:hypothetical protein
LCRLGKGGLVRIGEDLKTDTPIQVDRCCVASVDFEKDKSSLGVARPRRALTGLLGRGLECCGSIRMGVVERGGDEMNGLLDDLVADALTSPFRPDPKPDDEP